ncbi:MAG: potassium channel family protein [Thermosynechococcaceae cyanobacterium]
MSADKYHRIQRDLFLGIGAFSGVILLGTLWYWLVEGWRWPDALYMTVITLATVGFQEVNPLGDRGRLFTIVLIILGVVWLGYVVNRFTEAVIQGYFRGGYKIQQRQQQVGKLTEHYILCGFGRTGRQVAISLKAEQKEVLVIDTDPAAVEQAQVLGCPALLGRATLDQTLQQAGIEQACCVIAALPSDAENLYTVLSAKALNPQVQVVVRANTEEATEKLEQVGADVVVSPYMAVGKRMAIAALRPQVLNFMDVTLEGNQPTLYIEEIVLTDGVSVEQTLGGIGVRSQTGASVLAICQKDGTLITAPTGPTPLSSEDLLICLGTDVQLRALNHLLTER